MTVPSADIVFGGAQYDGDGYDHRPSALTTLIVHDRLPALRVMIDKGLDLRRFWRMMSHVGGGLRKSRVSIRNCCDDAAVAFSSCAAGTAVA